jgi:phosphatidylglycerol:prolipoprotein diacylglycerol transferase
MRSILFEIPYVHVRIFGYGFMLCVALLASMSLAAWLARRSKLDPNTIYDLALWLFVGGIVGARLFYVIQYWGTPQIQGLGDIFKIWQGGIVLYGSIMGGAAAFLVYRWRHPFPFRPMIDVVAPALAIGIAFGRLGCFLNGCCYGDLCHLPWGVSFPGPHGIQVGSAPWADQVRSGLIPRSAPWSLPVHPTQLYSTIDGLILCGLLLAYFPLRRRDGEVMALLMVTYPINRYLIEWLRGDEGVFFAGMTISQTISTVIFVGGVAFWAWLSRQPVGRYEDLAPAAEGAG